MTLGAWLPVWMDGAGVGTLLFRSLAVMLGSGLCVCVLPQAPPGSSKPRWWHGHACICEYLAGLYLKPEGASDLAQKNTQTLNSQNKADSTTPRDKQEAAFE